MASLPVNNSDIFRCLLEKLDAIDCRLESAEEKVEHSFNMVHNNV